MLKLQLFGHLGGDVRKVEASNGRTFLAFSVAHNHVNSATGDTTTTWVDCTLNRNVSTDLFSKGRFVYACGYPSFHMYTPAAGGAPRIGVSLRVTEFEFLDSKPQ